MAVDVPAPAPVPAGRPALVTMFRLLLNADETVRDRALGFAAQALPDASAGLLVLENHGNARSLRHLRARRHAGRRWFADAAAIGLPGSSEYAVDVLYVARRTTAPPRGSHRE